MKSVEPKIKTVNIDQLSDVGYADKADKLFGENKDEQTIVQLACDVKLAFDEVNRGNAKYTDSVRNSTLVFMTPRRGNNLILDMFGLFDATWAVSSVVLPLRVGQNFPKNLKHKAYALMIGKVKLMDLNRYFPGENAVSCSMGLPEDGLKLIIFQPQGLVCCEYKDGLLSVVDESTIQATPPQESDTNAETPGENTRETSGPTAPDNPVEPWCDRQGLGAFLGQLEQDNIELSH